MPGRLGSTFWKLLGASTEKNQARSLTEVEASADYEGKAKDLDDEKANAAKAAAHASGFPPKVEPCTPGVKFFTF